MKLYHGSKNIIDKPKVKGSREDNDYGPSFYLTKDLKSAHEWACRNNSIGVVNEYNFDLTGLKVLDLTDKQSWSVLNWVAILMHFRNLDSGFIKSFSNRLEFLERFYYVDVTQYDVVIGYRADDAYFRFPQDFIRGNITLEQLEYSFNLGSLGVQYALMNQKAFDKLHFVKSIPSEYKYLNCYFDNVTNATKSFDLLNKDEEGTRIIDIIRNQK